MYKNIYNTSGYGLVVEQMLPKHRAGVRFSLSAQTETLAYHTYTYFRECKYDAVQKLYL